MPLAPSAPDFSGWYLRGDIGFTDQQAGSLSGASHANFAPIPHRDFDAAPPTGRGIGYVADNWLDFDLPGGNRAGANCLNSPGCAGVGGSLVFARTASQWNFAWALHASLAYQVWRNVAPDLVYRYVESGHAGGGSRTRVDATKTFRKPGEFNQLTSHDVTLGAGTDPGSYGYAPPLPPLLRGKG
ncbi:MAG TPA: hypothetical protein VFB29_05745 [Pseudolabrys sp.]|nr:hypothetical protein [Pseudolabrys sp.]